MSTTAIIATLAAVAGGLFAAYVDFHATEVQATMAVILATSFAAGAICPRLAWLWALLVAACLTASHLIAPRFGIHPLDAVHGSSLSLMLVALPAGVSAYLGAASRWVLRFGIR